MSAYSDFVMRDLFQRSERPNLVMLNLFQHNAPPSIVILKQVQDDEFWVSVLSDDIGVGVLKHVQDDEAGAFSR